MRGRQVREALGSVRRGVRGALSRDTVPKDVVAGSVLGIQSVPDGLAAGLLAGVSPLAGLYAYMFGMLGAAAVTSSSFLSVQATGAMALVVSDTNLSGRPDPSASLAMMTLLTGVVILVAGFLGVGRLVRFAPVSVMTGFLTAVGANIVIGQLAGATGYVANGDNRIVRVFDTLLHIGQWKPSALAVAVVTAVVIGITAQTRYAGPGLVLAVVVGSVLAALLNLWVPRPVDVVGDIVTVPSGLPTPIVPAWGDSPDLLLPALSLAFVCVIQGAGVSSGLPTADGRVPDPNRDVLGQGVGNLVSGLLRGMPVGGSLSASILLVEAGARTRLALFVAGGVMGLTIIFAAPLVAMCAMPSLAALLIMVGVASISPSRVVSVWQTGPFQGVVMAVTFTLTLIIPLQFAVLVGIGLGIVLYVAEQSNRIFVREVHVDDRGQLRESDPPSTVEPGRVTILQPYGSLFFASAPNLEAQLPTVEPRSRNAVVILRLRATPDIDLATIDVLRRYAEQLREVGSTLKLVASDHRVVAQLVATGLSDEIGAQHVYEGSEWVGRTLRRAVADARSEIARTRRVE